MTRFVKSALGRLGRAARRRPLRAALAGLVVLGTAAATGGYAYAVREWHRAQAAVRERHPGQAKSHLAVCLSVWPRDPAVHQLAARAARETGDFVTAEDHLNTCLKLERGASEATQIEFLLMRAQSGEVEEVAPLLFLFVDRGHPDAPLILETIALTYMHNLRYGPAYACLVRWVREVPDSARAYHYRGWVLERLNQPKQALDDYLHALDLEPGLVPVRLRVAEMYLEDKQPLDALPHLERLREQAPDRPEVLARLGQCRFLQGETVEARRLLEAAAEALPDDPQVLLYLARLDLQDRQPARAEARLRHLLDRDPADTEARYTLVSALKFQRRDQEAARELAEYDRHKALLERANKLLQDEARKPTRDPGPAYEVGALLLQIRQERQGLYWMDQALARDPDHQPTHRALAEYFESKGDKERAAFHRRRLRPASSAEGGGP
jgi:predicted Zn-dependent protease